MNHRERHFPTEGTTEWISVGAYCGCGHDEAIHEGAGTECAYGWADDPAFADESPPCDCLGFVLDGHHVVPVPTEGTTE